MNKLEFALVESGKVDVISETSEDFSEDSDCSDHQEITSIQEDSNEDIESPIKFGADNTDDESELVCLK